MFFCKVQCDFSTYKDLVCLLSNLVEHVLIACGLFVSFSSFVILLYFAELSTTESRINLQVGGGTAWHSDLFRALLMLGLHAGMALCLEVDFRHSAF